MSGDIPKPIFRNYKPGQFVWLLVESFGETDDGEEVRFTPGAMGEVILVEGGRTHVVVEDAITIVLDRDELSGITPMF